jgi:hypothetical protein
MALVVLAMLSQTEGTHAYDLIGVGAWSCEAWQEARKSKNADVTEQWALGFLSGAAFITKDKTAPMRGRPPRAASDWLDSFCAAHPNETIAHGTEIFTGAQESTGH